MRVARKGHFINLNPLHDLDPGNDSSRSPYRTRDREKEDKSNVFHERNGFRQFQIGDMNCPLDAK